MKFVLEIELGNAAMERWEDIGAAVKETGERILRVYSGDPDRRDSGKIRDLNGNTVGKFEMIELTDNSDHQEQEIINLLWESLKRDPEHKDRRQTAWGTKTQAGLVACLNRIYQGEK